MNKAYRFDLDGHLVRVEADSEGEARYMVRMDAGKGRVRIGYLTGHARTWVAEFFGSRPSVRATSAKEACEALARVALNEPGFAWLKKSGLQLAEDASPSP